MLRCILYPYPRTCSVMDVHPCSYSYKCRYQYLVVRDYSPNVFHAAVTDLICRPKYIKLKMTSKKFTTYKSTSVHGDL